MTKTDRLKTLTNAVTCVSEMHGSVLGSPNFPHVVLAHKCTCEYGQTIRNLAEMKRDARSVPTPPLCVQERRKKAVKP